MAITVPPAMKLVSAKPNHRYGLIYYEATCVRRVIPEAKVAAVKAQLQTAANSIWGIDYGGAVAPYRDGRGFKVRFKTMLSETAFNLFLQDVETAITT